MDGRASVSMDERCIVTERGWTEMELRWTAVVIGYIVDGWEGEMDGQVQGSVGGRWMKGASWEKQEAKRRRGS